MPAHPTGPRWIFFLFLGGFLLSSAKSFAQTEIKLPPDISSVQEEYSGLALYHNRLYLLPQYGSNPDKSLQGAFFLYSLHLDSLHRVLKGKGAPPELTHYRKLRVRNLEQLPAAIQKEYEGFEALVIVGNQVFLTMETVDSSLNCYLLAGRLDTARSEVVIDTARVRSLPRFSFVHNAGFEALTFLPAQNKLLALDEFNASGYGSKGYLLDTALTGAPQIVDVPTLYFRLTDIAAADSSVYALNYYWNGDYTYYLKNCMVGGEEKAVAATPDIQEQVRAQAGYLSDPNTCYTRIVKLGPGPTPHWEQVKKLETACSGNNWEGLVVLESGFLLISDANRSKRLKTTLVFIEK
jgi:hypothetical protein